MPTTQLNVPKLANFEIQVDNNLLPTAVGYQAISIRIEQQLNLPSMFAIELAGLDDQVSLLDDRQPFWIGKHLQIRLGSTNRLKPLMNGEITGLEPEFVLDRPPSLLVRGYDSLHRLQRDCKTRAFTQVKDSFIAQAITSEFNLVSQISDSRVTHDYVLQANQTDFDFLLERAHRIDYEVFIRDRRFYFRPADYTSSTSLTLVFGYNLLAFYPRLSVVGQPSDVSIRDRKSNRIEAQGQPSRSMGKLRGDKLGDRAFGKANHYLTGYPYKTHAEAQQIADAYFSRTGLKFLRADGICQGNPDLQIGNVIRIDEIGQQFSGRYYVTAVSHRYGQDGYYTHFTVQRNAL